MATQQGFNNINFKINFQTGDKSAFASLKKELQEIKNLAESADFGLDQTQVNQVLSTANTIERAMTKAYDPQLNTVNIQKFNTLLKQSGTDINKVKQDLSIMGATGSNAFMKMTGQLMEINPTIKQTNAFLDDLSKTLFNTVKYTVFNNLLSSISSTIQQSYYYVKDLDRGLNDIRIVTGKSADEMSRFAEQANNAAKALAVTTEDYTEGSLIYYQQGLDDTTVKTLTDITAKTSNVTRQGMSTVSEQLTAVLNGYQVANRAAEEGMQVYEEYVDKMAAVGAATASDLEELSTAMSKVASAASSMGVDFDDLNAQIATIVSVTRQAPESVGTALKTIYARLGDLKVDGVDEFGTKLGEVSSQLQTMGVNIIDPLTGDMRNMSDVMAEVAVKLSTLTEAQKQAAAVAMAGKRQYNNLIALFDNWDMYGEALETSMNAAGTLERQQEIAMESLANKMDVLKATAEDLYDSLFNTDTIGNFIDLGTGVLQFLADFTDGVGGLNNILPTLFAYLTQIFSKQIAAGAESIVTNITRIAQAGKLAEENIAQLKLVFENSSFLGGEGQEGRVGAAFEQGMANLSTLYEKIGQYQSIMNEQEKQNYDLLKDKQIKINEQRNTIAELVDALDQGHNKYELISKDILNNVQNSEELSKSTNNINEIIKELENTYQRMETAKADGKESGFRFQNANNGSLVGGIDYNGIQAYLDTLQEKFNLTDDAVIKLANDLVADNFDKAKEKFQALINKLKETGEYTSEISKLISEAERGQGVIDNFIGAMGSQLDLRGTIENVTQLASKFGQLAMAINTIRNIGNILENEDLSTGEKILQTLMNIGFVAPTILNNLDLLSKGFNKFSDVIAPINKLKEEMAAVKAVEEATTAATAANTAAEEAHTLATEAQAFAAEKEVIAQSALGKIQDTTTKKLIKQQAEKLLASRKNIASMTEEQIAQEAFAITANKNSKKRQQMADAIAKEVIARRASKAATDADATATEADSIAEGKNTAVTNANTTSQELHNAALLKKKILTLAAIGAIIALTVAIGAAIKAYEKHREEIVENNKAELEKIEQTEKEIEQNKELAKSFKDVYKEYKETGEITDQLKSATEQLIETYRIENGYLLERTENYKELNRILDETREKELDIAATKSTQGQKLAAKNMAIEGAKGLFNSGVLIGDSYQSHLYSDAGSSIIEETAKRHNIKVGKDYRNNQIATGFDINNIEQAYEYYNYLLEAKAKYEKEFTNSELNSLTSYKQITQELKAMSESYDQLSDQRQEFLNADFERTFVEELKGIDETSISEVYNKIEDIRNKFSEKFSDNELNNLIQESLDSLTNFSDTFVTQVLVSQAYLDKHHLLLTTDINEEDILKTISTLNDKQLAYLTLHLNSAVLSDDLAQLIQQHDKYFTYSESKEVSGSLKDFIGQYDTKKGFKEDAISPLYESSNLIEEKTGYSEEQFRGLDIDQQLQVATKGLIELAKASNEAGKALREEVEPEFEEVEIQLKELQLNANNASIVIRDLIKDDSELVDKQEELEKALIELSKVENYDDLDENTKQLIKDFADLTHTNVESLKVLGENLTYTEALQSKYDDLKSQLDEVTESEVDFKEIMEQVSEITAATNSIIDEIQKSYKSLIEIVDNYNETGKLTIDNVQTLMEMSDQYVAQLEIEGNTLSLNEEGFKAVTLAKLDDLVATENLSYEQKVLELAQIAEGNSTDAAAQKTSLFTQMLATLGLVARETSNEVLNLDAAMRKIANSGSAETQAALDQATKAHENRLKALEALREQINSSTGSGGLRDMMGASKKSSKSGKDKSKDEKELEDEFDRYWEIKKAIDAVDLSLKRLDKDKQNLYGYELIDALKQENQLLEQQSANYERLYEMQQMEAAELREQLGTMGLMFDASGAITNYAAATSQALQTYAAAIEQYNAGLMDETTLKVYEKSYENFKKLLEKYDKLYYTDMQNTQDKLDEIRRKQLANNLKALEVEIQIHLDAEKAKREWNDFLKDIKQDFTKVYKDLTIDVKYDRQNFQSFVNDVGTTIGAINDVEAEINKMMNGGTSDMFESVSQAQEKLKELQEQLLQQGKDLYALYKQVWDTYLEGIDQVKDQFDELMSRYEQFTKELDFQRQLIELLYGDKAYDLMDKYYEAQSKNINAQIESLKKQADYWQSEFNKSYESALKRGTKVDLNDFTTLTEDMKKAYENMIESQGNLNDLIIEAVEILQKQYLNSINKIMDTMDKGLLGSGGFEEIKSDLEFMQKMADEYLDAVEGASAIQSFANKMDMDKMNASSLKAQQKIAEFREKEIKALREKENLTQADIDLAEARYQIMLKEIALEDAQNNKTSMKLTRNEQGNLSYQYVADEDDVASKQQDLLQSYTDLYKLADDSYNHAMELSMDIYEEYRDKVRALYEDTTLSEEERDQKILELQDKYFPMMEAALANSELYKQEAMIASAGVFKTVCDQDSTAYDKLTQEQKDLVDSLKEKNFEDYDAMRTAIIEGYYPDLQTEALKVFEDLNVNSQTLAAQIIGQLAKDPSSVKNEINKAIAEMNKAVQDYESELDKLQKIAGINFSKIGDYIDQVSQKIDNMSGTTEKMVDNSSAYLDELRSALEAVAEKLNSVIDQILEAQRAMQEYINLAAQARAASAAASGGGAGSGSAGSPTGPGGNGSGSTGTNEDSDNSNSKGGPYYVSSTRVDDNRGYGPLRFIVKSTSGNEKVEYLSYDKQNFENRLDDLRRGLTVGTPVGFRAGGYTGELGNAGRLAMLHEKELVLNADDTENFLSGISMIRDMTSLNGSISNAITNAVANMALTLGKSHTSSGFSTGTEETAATNIFNITAEFPNASDVNEIRQAILSLPNLASQYIGKNIR